MSTEEVLKDLMDRVERYGDSAHAISTLKTFISAAYARGMSDGMKTQRKMTRHILGLEETK